MVKKYANGSAAPAMAPRAGVDVELLASEADIRARPKFAPDTPVAVDKVQAIVGYYERLPQTVPCQVQENGGALCGQQHATGWLARLVDGREGLVGSVCCRKKFKDHVPFSSTLTQARRSVRSQHAMSRLREFTDPGTLYAARLAAAKAAFAAYRDKYRFVTSKIGPRLRATPADRAKRGHAMVMIETLHVETEKDGKKTRRWIPHQLGRVNGLAAFVPETPVAVSNSLHAASAAFAAAAAAASDEKANPVAVERLIRALAELDRIEAQVGSLAGDLAAFSAMENLKLACLLVSSETEQAELAGYLVALHAVDLDASTRTASALVQALHRAVRQQHGNEFRIRD
jgi:hypothetical protein